jgi:hypothetical protein
VNKVANDNPAVQTPLGAAERVEKLAAPAQDSAVQEEAPRQRDLFG